MRIAIRTDASPAIGTGHLRRCLTLADALTGEGAEVRFLVTPGEGDGIGLLERRGRRVDRVVAENVDADARATVALLAGWEADWIVADRYRLGRLWEEGVRRVAQRLMVIDDLADTPHVADLLLDQNFYPDPARRYVRLVPHATRTLLGPAYALIDPAFAAARAPEEPVRTDAPYRIVVSFGGGDDRGAAVKTLAALALLRRDDLAVTLVVGAANPRRQEIADAARNMAGVAILDAVDDMVALLADADLAVGAGGVSTWERFCLGVPTLALTVAPVQKSHLRALAAEGFLQWEGEAAQIAPAALAAQIGDLLDDPATRQNLRERTMGLVDGNGGRRVARAMLDY